MTTERLRRCTIIGHVAAPCSQASTDRSRRSARRWRDSDEITYHENAMRCFLRLDRGYHVYRGFLLGRHTASCYCCSDA